MFQLYDGSHTTATSELHDAAARSHCSSLSVDLRAPLLDLVHPIKAGARSMDAARVCSVLVVLQAHSELQSATGSSTLSAWKGEGRQSCAEISVAA